MDDEQTTPAPGQEPVVPAETTAPVAAETQDSSEPQESTETVNEPAVEVPVEQEATPVAAVESEPTPEPHVAVAAPVAAAPEPEPLPVAPSVPTASPASEPRRGMGAGGVVAIAFVMALLFGSLAGGMAGFAASWFATHGESGSSGSSTISVVPSETDEPIVAAAAASAPSVVNIDITGETVTDDSGALPQDHPSVPVSGNGSGVAWMATDDGGTYIITNAHVVSDASSIMVTDSNRERHVGEMIGIDADTDIGVVKVDVELPLIAVGDSDTLQVGQATVAIGSPFGLSQSVSAGVVSAIGRSLPNSISSQEGMYPLVDVIQTDAAINPGNSGGALVDRLGQLIGINTAIYSESGTSGGVGFAVPGNTAVRIAQDLVEKGSADHPFLGILGQDVTPALAEEEGLPVEEGAYIVDVTPGTNAEKADLQTGDVVVMLDEDPILSMDDLILEVRRREIGDVVTLTIYRDGEKMEVEMEVGVKPQNLDLSGSETATDTP